jgi:hypothetical protein
MFPARRPDSRPLKLHLLALLLLALAAGGASLSPLPRPARAQEPPLTRVGGLGGAFGAPVAGEECVYLPEGPALAVIDTSNPTVPRRVGRVMLPERLTLHQRSV